MFVLVLITLLPIMSVLHLRLATLSSSEGQCASAEQVKYLKVYVLSCKDLVPYYMSLLNQVKKLVPTVKVCVLYYLDHRYLQWANLTLIDSNWLLRQDNYTITDLSKVTASYLMNYGVLVIYGNTTHIVASKLLSNFVLNNLTIAITEDVELRKGVKVPSFSLGNNTIALGLAILRIGELRAIPGYFRYIAKGDWAYREDTLKSVAVKLVKYIIEVLKTRKSNALRVHTHASRFNPATCYIPQDVVEIVGYEFMGYVYNVLGITYEEQVVGEYTHYDKVYCYVTYSGPDFVIVSVQWLEGESGWSPYEWYTYYNSLYDMYDEQLIVTYRPQGTKSWIQSITFTIGFGPPYVAVSFSVAPDYLWYSADSDIPRWCEITYQLLTNAPNAEKETDFAIEGFLDISRGSEPYIWSVKKVATVVLELPMFTITASTSDSYYLVTWSDREPGRW